MKHIILTILLTSCGSKFEAQPVEPNPYIIWVEELQCYAKEYTVENLVILECEE